MAGQNWNRDELLLALNLYCQLPFGKYHNRNPEIIYLAGLIGRTPNAVAMKLSNFASLDPAHQARGVKGLVNASRADRDIWAEFHANWDEMVLESALKLQHLTGNSDQLTPPITPTPSSASIAFTGPTEAIRQIKVRIGQDFFRRVILTSYSARCCICGMPIPELLVASHIVAWRDNENLRVNPHNGLCLCALHDKGFDRGLVTLGPAYDVIVGRTLRHYLPEATVEQSFIAFEGRPIQLPDKFIPDQTLIEFHRLNYFLG